MVILRAEKCFWNQWLILLFLTLVCPFILVKIKRCSNFTIYMPAFTLQPLPLTNPHAILTHTGNYLSCLTICYHTHASKSIYFTVLFHLLFLLSIWCLSVFLTSRDKSSLPPVLWLNRNCLVQSIKNVCTFHKVRFITLRRL